MALDTEYCVYYTIEIIYNELLNVSFKILKGSVMKSIIFFQITNILNLTD